MSDKTPFQRATDELTDGCGCACHTGTGYRTACEHCSPAAGSLAAPADDAAQVIEKLAAWAANEHVTLGPSEVQLWVRVTLQALTDTRREADYWKLLTESELVWTAEEALARLRPYARHDKYCNLPEGVRTGVGCTCGLDDARAVSGASAAPDDERLAAELGWDGATTALERCEQALAELSERYGAVRHAYAVEAQERGRLTDELAEWKHGFDEATDAIAANQETYSAAVREADQLCARCERAEEALRDARYELTIASGLADPTEIDRRISAAQFVIDRALAAAVAGEDS